MNLVLFGANGPTGRLLTQQALAAGHQVAAVTRRPDGFPVQGAHLKVVEADVHDPKAVEHAVHGADAVLSTLGVPFSRRPITVYSEGVRNIVAAMHRHGVRRLVVVSSSATEPHHHADGGFLLNHVFQPLITATLGKTLYEDMRRMEALVRASDLDWTIMRPSGLFDSPAVTDYRMDEDQAPGVFTSRADLAASMLRQLTDDRFLRKAVAVTTTALQPSMLQMIWTEGIKKK